MGPMGPWARALVPGTGTQGPRRFYTHTHQGPGPGTRTQGPGPRDRGWDPGQGQGRDPGSGPAAQEPGPGPVGRGTKPWMTEHVTLKRKPFLKSSPGPWALGPGRACAGNRRSRLAEMCVPKALSSCYRYRYRCYCYLSKRSKTGFAGN